MIKMTREIAATLSVAEQHEWFKRATSRRSLLRGSLLGASAAAAGSTLFGAGAVSAATPTLMDQADGSPSVLGRAPHPSGTLVVPFGRHVAYGADPTRQMAVSWQVRCLPS